MWYISEEWVRRVVEEQILHNLHFPIFHQLPSEREMEELSYNTIVENSCPVLAAPEVVTHGGQTTEQIDTTGRVHA